MIKNQCLIPLLIVCSLLLLPSCTKIETIPCNECLQLPSQTETGEGTMGCLVDGGVWLLSGTMADGIGFRVPHRLEVNHFDDYVSVSGLMTRNCEGEEIITQNLDFSITNLLDTGVYIIDEEMMVELEYDDWNEFGHYTAVSGFIKLNTYDLQDSIISGIFDCTLIHSIEPQDTIRITQGRFDGRII
ncbi:MAG: hypothetical protein AB8B53_01755 [Flavobacteriales bacterium]